MGISVERNRRVDAMRHILSKKCPCGPRVVKLRAKRECEFTGCYDYHDPRCPNATPPPDEVEESGPNKTIHADLNERIKGLEQRMEELRHSRVSNEPVETDQKPITVSECVDAMETAGRYIRTVVEPEGRMSVLIALDRLLYRYSRTRGPWNMPRPCPNFPDPHWHDLAGECMNGDKP